MKINLFFKVLTFSLFVLGNGFLTQCVSPDVNKDGIGGESTSYCEGDWPEKIANVNLHVHKFPGLCLPAEATQPDG